MGSPIGGWVVESVFPCSLPRLVRVNPNSESSDEISYFYILAGNLSYWLANYLRILLAGKFILWLFARECETDTTLLGNRKN